MKLTFVKIRFIAVAWVIGLLLAHPSQVPAVLFDWDTVTWTPGSLSGSYEIDSSNPGNDITITITGNTSRFISNYPQITQDFTGGLSPTQDILDVFVNYGSDSQALTITVTFNYALGVEDVGFTLFDIDRTSSASFVDQIRTIKANYNGGSDIAATSVTGSANNAVSGSGLGVKVTGTAQTPDTGGSSGDANATISFGPSAITGFSFVYGNDPAAQSNPAQQGIGIHDISFKKRIPEYHPALAASLMCGLMGAWRSVRRRLAGS